MDLGTIGGLKALAWCRWTVGAWQLTEDLGWRLGNCEYCSPDLAPILTKPQEGRKEKSSPPLPVASRKTSRTCSVDLKPAGGFPPPSPLPSLFVFLPPSETIRPGALKGPEADPKRKHRANPNN